MWFLESPDGSFGGRRLWLRPGKTYLFGRTTAEPGQLAISHNTISRKHLTITIDPVEQGHAHSPSSRPRLTIEDLATKIGTFVDGVKIRGEKHVVKGAEAELVMAKCPTRFRLTWRPVVFTFSFTSRELQSRPFTTLQERFEQLDIKLLTEYHSKWTTHVVSKKRNTAKGLQALINGKHIVTESFLDAVVQAAAPLDSDGNGVPTSLLEQDFQRHWPDEMEHLPPPGGEPVQHPDTTYAPDSGRRNVFEGYTFIFYDQSQFNNLLGPITDGGAKAHLKSVVPEETEVDDFVRAVKSLAGEKGLGSFEDGGEGKGVVLVRYVPAKGAQVAWYTDFFRAVSLRLDHRPIEQSEFLEAILTKDAGILRRPLEVESSEPNAQSGSVPQQAPSTTARETSQPRRPPAGRRAARKRFAGFDNDSEVEMEDVPSASAPPPEPETSNDVADEGGLFVSQEPPQEAYATEEPDDGRRRKRQASTHGRDDLMDGMAPAAARFKRQRMEQGQAFASPSPEPQPEPEEAGAEQQPKKKKTKEEVDIMAAVAQNRQQEEERARREKEDLANLPDDVDLSEIRRLNIVEEVEVRRPAGATRTREQDIADGRWDPRWNGMKNFKRFRRRGEVAGRQPARVIVELTEVKAKEFGVGDDYWLEDEPSTVVTGGSGSNSNSNSNSNNNRRGQTTSQTSAAAAAAAAGPAAARRPTRGVVVASDSDDDDDDDDDDGDGEPDPAPQPAARPPQTRQTQQSNQGSGGKRSATGSTEQQQGPPAKRQRPAPRKVIEVADSDDSDDEFKFRFGKRR
ncbi:FHA protein [Geosmithia morbida]|uniref:FHA protein n=1 Tax=Geosmithia morbida TaxID=1094350 RepID=A0A9P5D5U8_9HYPO|nr:FHA protein [Geosmithia morbida]KAF4124936.1 FHA protein [Geosmithia morbida]